MAFPVPALLRCALTFSVFTTSCLTFCFSAWSLLAISVGILPVAANFDSRQVILSISTAVALVALAPLIVSSVMMARNEALERLIYMATHNQLTGLPNRRPFFDTGSKFLEDISTSQTCITITVFDLDHFKAINDTYGHATGDRTLSAFARVLTENLRKSDIFGRIGGEEFAAILINYSQDNAIEVANRICMSFSSMQMQAADGRPFLATVSVGLREFRGTLPCLDDLLAAADATLYRAKALGRDRVEVYRNDCVA